MTYIQNQVFEVKQNENSEKVVTNPFWKSFFDENCIDWMEITSHGICKLAKLYTSTRSLKFLIPNGICDAASTKPLGERDSLGKLYTYIMQDGNHNIHLGAIGHGGTESNTEWWFFLHRVLKVCFKMFGNNFNIFDDNGQY